MLERLFPAQADKTFAGHRAALWLLGLLIALKLAMSINSILNTESVAVGADGFPLDRFGPEAARAVLMLFALTSLGQLALALTALAALVRYRTLVPLAYLLLVGEQLARRFIIQGYAVERAGGGGGGYINLAILAVLTLGLVLSVVPGRRRASDRPN